jgi:small subunit ribosomal protein S2
MPTITLKDLLDAGVHFGHQTKRWNPKMKPYIFGQKNGIHIINLQKTAIQLGLACEFISHSVASGEKVLFVGTKRQASEIVAEAARGADQYWVTHRWLGGMLTNYKTVKASVDRLNKLERDREEGRFEVLSKKEQISKERQITKLKASLGGIQEMTALPGVLFIIDPNKEHIAVLEARRLGIPIVAVVDSNCDPDGISFVIPGNDDALKAIRLFANAISDACVEGRDRAKDFARREYMNMGAQVGDVAESTAPAPEVLVKTGGDDDDSAEAAAPASEEAAPAEATEEAAPAEASEEAAPAEEAALAATDEAATDEAATDEAAEEETPTEEAVEVASSDAAPAETPEEEAAEEETPSEEAVEAAAADAPATDAADEEAATGEAPAAEAAAGDATDEEPVAAADTSPREAPAS